jgi:hypothetical protein
MKEQVAQYRNITLTEGGADVFVQATEYTGIDSGAGYGWLIKRIETMIPLAQAIEAIAADNSIAFSLSNRSLTAVGDLTDSDVIYVDGTAGQLVTTGFGTAQRKFVWDAPDGVIVVSPALYAQLDSTGTGLSLTAHMRIYYEPVKLTELEILRMLSQS